MIELLTDTLLTPIAELTIVARDGKLCLLDFDGNDARIERLMRARFGPTTLIATSDPFGITSVLRRYFDGEIAAIDEVEVDGGGTPFQQIVWRALRAIPHGEVISYGELAARIGRPTASRAVGHANSQNPIAIVVPCHRVIGSSATLTGYAGGLERKRWLLAHEGADLSAVRKQRVVVQEKLEL